LYKFENISPLSTVEDLGNNYSFSVEKKFRRADIDNLLPTK
jgi:hypothetical protein